MTYVVCPKCQNPNVMVPEPNRICFDCAYRTPEERNQRWETLERCLQQSQRSLRDEFAMRAMVAIVAGEAPNKHFTDLAYEWADLMLKSRVLPESG